MKYLNMTGLIRPMEGTKPNDPLRINASVRGVQILKMLVTQRPKLNRTPGSGA